jgi:hypothetical protein
MEVAIFMIADIHCYGWTTLRSCKQTDTIRSTQTNIALTGIKIGAGNIQSNFLERDRRICRVFATSRSGCAQFQQR